MEQKVATDHTDAKVTSSWNDCLDYLKGRISSPYYASMITPLRPISLENGTFTIAVPNTFTKDMVESKFIDNLAEAATKAFGKECRVVLTVASSPELIESMVSRSEMTEKDPELTAGENTENLLVGGATPVHKKYTFENFIVGDSNKFAYNAALMVAEVPGHNYNPLFIYGGTGLGKTHLLLAIKDYSEKLNPNIKVRYVQTSQ
jgi:chromosomal replication initiator protein